MSTEQIAYSEPAEESLAQQAREAAEELITLARLRPGQILVVGCSTSEVRGARIGTDSAPQTAAALFGAIQAVCQAHGVYLAAQCCEHLNRALVIERAALPGAEPVNAVPRPKAGGSFATAAYAGLREPIVVEHLRADAGLDIGGTLIGMHLREVAVPVRLRRRQIGQALVLAARTRPKFIGGARAEYDPALL